VTGALGQIGSELIPALRERYENDRVVASDIRVPPRDRLSAEGGFEHVDCTHIREIEHAVRRHDVGTIYHLAALLSVVAEDKPRVAWEVNMGGLYRVLEGIAMIASTDPNASARLPLSTIATAIHVGQFRLRALKRFGVAEG